MHLTEDGISVSKHVAVDVWHLWCVMECLCWTIHWL